ncbi:MAG: hypothetical protein JF595_01140 [Sphingomonadales bacterium]|nr:hypothetical protein [Sphingomonadales bacterium]
MKIFPFCSKRRAKMVRHCWTPVLKARFLRNLAGGANVRASCASVGMSREAAYKLRRRDPIFAYVWDAALVLARETRCGTGRDSVPRTA